MLSANQNTSFAISTNRNGDLIPGPSPLGEGCLYRASKSNSSVGYLNRIFQRNIGERKHSGITNKISKQSCTGASFSGRRRNEDEAVHRDKGCSKTGTRPCFYQSIIAIVFTILLCHCFSLFTLQAQNINHPNVTGPLGTEVNTASGNLFLRRNDVQIPVRGMMNNLYMMFDYNSFDYSANTGYGNGWSFVYSMHYKVDTANAVTITWGDDRDDRYTVNGSNYTAPVGIFDQLSQYQTGKYRLTTKQGISYYFDNSQHRRLTKITDPNGNALTMNYTDSLVTSISSSAGQMVALSYMNGKLQSVTDALASPNRTWNYTYDATGNLLKVTDPLSGTMQFSYLTNGPMSSMTDPNMNQVNIIYYTDFTVSELIGCNSRKSFSYDTTLHRTTVTDYLPNSTNQVTTYSYKYYGSLVWLTDVTGNCCGYHHSNDFDASGNVTKQTDANGGVYSYTYDGRGNILSITDPLSQIMRYTYSSDFNRITSFTDAKGYVHTLEYDTQGNIVKLTEPGSLVYTGTYSTNGDLLTSTDPKGNKDTYSYNAYGYLAGMVSSSGFSASYTYDARGNLLTQTDARGNTFTGQYDLLNRLKMITDPLNELQKISYDAASNITGIINQNNETTALGYDASNRLVRVMDANGKSAYVSYDPMDNITGWANRLGYKATYAYDSRNRLSNVKDPAGNVNTYSYDAMGNLTAISYPNGRTLTRSYDVLGRIISQNDGTGSLGSVTYDANNNITSFTNAIGAVSTATYDNLNRLTSYTDPLGNTERYTYDANDNITAFRDRNGNTSNYTYDSLDRIKTRADNGGGTIVYTYDGQDNITTITDQNNHATTYTYDSLNRVRRTTYPDGKYMELSYDAKGNVLTKRMGDGQIITYTYDSLNRVRSKNTPGTSTYTYTYDANDRLLTATNASGTTSFIYDAIDRVISETFNGRTTSYVYNVSGRTLTTFYPDSTTVIKSYDTRNRLTAISRNGGAIATYQYDASNRLTGISYGNGVTTAMQYDFANRLGGITSGTGSVQNKTISYDATGNKLSVNNLLNPQQSEQFTYDSRNRLVNYKRGLIGGTPVLEKSFAYDAVGNRTSITLNGSTTNYSVNNLNQLTAATGGTTATYTYDDRGNQTWDGSFYKKYNAAGQLLTDSASSTNTISYLYDGMGRRIRKTVNGKPINYYYSGLSQIMQTDGNTDTTLNKTVFGVFILPVALDKGSNTYQYHFNEIYSVDALTGSGGVAERYQYDPYGATTIFDAGGNPIAASATGNRFGFTGQEYDKETNTYHFHYRNYLPATGTFEQRDPIGYADQMGLYQYVDNDPASGIDVLGLAPCPPTITSQSTTVISHSTNYTTIVNYLAQLQRLKDKVGKFKGINDGGESLSDRSGTFSKFNIIQQIVNLELQANKYLQDEPYLTDRGQHTRLAELETGLIGLTGDIANTKAPGNPFSKAATVIAVADALSNEITGNSLAKNYADLDVPSINLANRFLRKAEERYKWDQKRIDAARKLFGDDQTTWTDDLRETYERHQKAAKTYTQTATTDWIEGYDPDNCPPQTPNGTQKPPPRPSPPGTPGHTEVLNSKDPNEIIGPDGVAVPKWVSVNDNLPYLINYENSHSASAPAKTVRIIYPIDPKQDKNTFALGSYGFNNQTYSVPAGTNAYYQRLDVRDSLGLYVDVTAGLDVQNNQAFWFFQSIDPTTLLPTTAPLAGFLSLQDSASPNKGHGFVNFTIKPLAADHTGDTMHAVASIVFDGNDTIPTNYAKNTIDAVAPASHMNSTNYISPTTTFSLSWAGQDDPGGSGVRSYALYYSVDYSSVFNLYRSGITRTDTTFTGSPGVTYRFFVLATDSVGNVEKGKPNPEVTVLVDAGVLPITWLSFTAELHGKDGLLNWATATESNSRSFAIERSTNGRNFMQAGSVAAAGNSSIRRNYAFTDSNIVALKISLVYYRLKQLDNNGNFIYSAIVAVPLPVANLAPAAQVYPNPFSNTLNLLLTNMPAAASGDNVSLYTIDGKDVYSKTLGAHAANITITLGDLPPLNPGIYLLKFTNGKQVYTFKLMKE